MGAALRLPNEDDESVVLLEDVRNPHSLNKILERRQHLFQVQWWRVMLSNMSTSDMQSKANEYNRFISSNEKLLRDTMAPDSDSDLSGSGREYLSFWKQVLLTRIYIFESSHASIMLLVFVTFNCLPENELAAAKITICASSNDPSSETRVTSLKSSHYMRALIIINRCGLILATRASFSALLHLSISLYSPLVWCVL